MEATVKRVAFGSLAVLLTFGAMADDPQISSVTVRQRWPWSKLVDIDYVLTADSTQNVGIAVQAYDGDTPLTLPSTSLTGDLYSVPRGMRRIVWDPTRTAYTNNRALTKFSVQLMPTNPPTYLVVDMVSGDITPYDCGTNLMAEATNTLYMTAKMLLRHIPAGAFALGDSATPSRSRTVTLTKDYYISVHEVTAHQWGHVMVPGRDMGVYWNRRAIRGPSYYDIREIPGGDLAKTGSLNYVTSGSAITPTWPVTSAVGTNSFIGLLRAKTNRIGFDLPTSAQWEYACRAGATADYYNGTMMATNAAGEDANLDLLAIYTKNRGGDTPILCTKQPNAWGLYDMLGGQKEWCLDWQNNINDPVSSTFSTTGETDPAGYSTGTGRVMRGGDYLSAASSCRAFNMLGIPRDQSHYTTGFRVVLTLD